MICRFCGKQDIFKFLDLGSMALANGFLKKEQLQSTHEPVYPLDVFFCERCGLVQIGYAVLPDALFQNYIYFSSTSDLVHKHAEYLAHSFHKRFSLNERSQVVEIASNDGTVLRYFQKIPVRTLGIEPAVNIAAVARQAGIDTYNAFFNETTARTIRQKYGLADVILGRHVFAHVPEIHGFVKGLKDLLAANGAIAIEAPYLLDFIQNNEFDTIYHEHYSYLSVRAMAYLCHLYDLEVFDVERVAIHGGSIIYFIGHKGAHAISATVDVLKTAELELKLDQKATYVAFAQRVQSIKNSLLSLLRELKAAQKRVAAYGAPAKGNTLLNYCGITTDLVEYTVDKSPHKQGLFTPGAHLPVYHPDRLVQDMPDYVLLLAWNFAEEIFVQQTEYRDRGGRFIIPIPEVTVIR